MQSRQFGFLACLAAASATACVQILDADHDYTVRDAGGGDTGSLTSGSTSGSGGGMSCDGGAPLCDNQSGPCAGAEKSQCAEGVWTACTDADYLAYATPACDDGDPCTDDAPALPLCDAGCRHEHTCAAKSSFSPVADATVRSDQATTNFGDDPELLANKHDNTDEARAFLRFDPFAGGVHYAHIDHAFLTLHLSGSGYASVSVYPVLGAWTEAGITWANAPGIGSSGVAPVQTANDGPVVFDVTELVSAWNQDPASNFGIALAQSDPFGFDDMVFSSKEGPEAPELEIVVNAKTIALGAVADTHVQQDVPTKNYGAQPEMAFTTGPPSSFSRLLLQFDTSSLPSSAVVLHAELTLQQTSGQWLGPAVAHVVTQSWTETGATWNAFPTYHAAELGKVTSPGIFGGAKTLGITSTLAAWLAGTTPNHGLVVRNSYEGTAGASRTAMVGAHENADTAVRPKVNVWYK